MTTLKRSLILGLMILMLGCLLAACASSDGVNGTYTFQKTTKIVKQKVDGVEEKVEKELTAKETGLKLDLELMDGGKAKLTVNGKEVTGTWEQKDDIITVTGDEVVYEFVLSGKTLTMTQGDVKIILSK